jgi:hypothetical protein
MIAFGVRRYGAQGKLRRDGEVIAQAHHSEAWSTCRTREDETDGYHGQPA